MVSCEAKKEFTVKFNPYLNFNGTCEAAFKFYERCFGGKIAMLSTFGENPGMEHVPADMRNKIMHARLLVGDAALMGCDTIDPNFDKPKGVYVSADVADPGQADRIFG